MPPRRETGASTPAEIAVQKGVVSHARTNRRATFGALAAKASTLPAPTDVKVKDPKEFTLIGRAAPRVDSASKTDGSAIFTMDFSLPGMLTAVIARPPRFGAKVKSFDPSAARRVRGVADVVEVPAGVAVVARNFWAARKGREALTIEWDESGAEKRGSDELFAAYRKLVEKPGAIARRDGDATAAIAGAVRTLEAVYEFPYLAHAPMEPIDCVVRLGDGECELWAGSQLPTVDQMPWRRRRWGYHRKRSGFTRCSLAEASAGAPRRARTWRTRRRASRKRCAARQPIKLVWTREDDIRGGLYRPLYVHRLRAGLDSSGRIVGWEHRIVGQSIAEGNVLRARNGEGRHRRHVGRGRRQSALRDSQPRPSSLHTTEVGIPVLWWRSVGSTHTAFSTETFLDELAHAAGQRSGGDPPEAARAPSAAPGCPQSRRREGRLGDARLPKGRARGVAVHESFNSFVAQVAEVSLDPDGAPKVERVVCAVDCGVAINPDVIRAQMEGGIGFGLGAALWSEITLVEGRVQQSNFNDYRGLRIEQMPTVEVHIVPFAGKAHRSRRAGRAADRAGGCKRPVPPDRAARTPFAVRAAQRLNGRPPCEFERYRVRQALF